MTLETLTACPISASTNLEPVTNGRVPGSRCVDCAQVFLNPRMDDASAAAFYLGAYRDKVSAKDTNGVDPVDLERQRDRAHNQIHACWDLLEGSRTMLEIGCSAGNLMDKMNINFDTECVGVEPDIRYHAVDPACNYKLYRDTAEVPPRQFDLIAMSHSLEHMQHPLQFLEALRDGYTGPRSRFLVEVPNYEMTPLTLNDNHPFAFSETTLNGLFSRLGYKPLLFVKHGLKWPPALYLLGIYGRKE